MTDDKVNGGIDLEQFDTRTLANDGFWVVIVNPRDDKPTDIKICILGQDSDKYREITKRQTATNLQITMKQTRHKEEKLVENVDEGLIELLAATTIAWEGMTYQNQPLEFNFRNAKWLYTSYPIIRDQVTEAQRDRANFLPSSPKN